MEQTRGYVRYKVHLKPCLDVADYYGTYSHAKIFFDSQDPVGTNTTYTDFDECINEPLCAISDGGNSKGRSVKDKAEAVVYPNPFINEVNLEVDGAYLDGKTSITVFDAQGRRIQNITKSNLANENGKIKLHTKNWNQGLYLVLVQNGSHQKTFRCIKQN